MWSDCTIPRSNPDSNPNSQADAGSDRKASGTRDPDRVRRLTFKRDQDRIDERTLDALRVSSNQGVIGLTHRLEELDREWPVDRALMIGAGGAVWLGLILGSTVKRRLYILSAMAGGLLFVYSLFGWVPPVLLLRRLGFRTRGEIDSERMALKALRGDFESLAESQMDFYGDRVDLAMKAAKA
jgi:hypothetical protein